MLNNLCMQLKYHLKIDDKPRRRRLLPALDTLVVNKTQGRRYSYL